MLRVSVVVPDNIQFRVVLCPIKMVLGDAVKLVILAATTALTVIVTLLETDPVELEAVSV